ncbi:MAG: hypothetical protein ACJ72E_05935 [Marmoricola sp.]
MTVSEPPPPEQGTSAAERGRDVSEAQREVEVEPTWARRLVAAANPKVLLSQAESYPVGIKQFLQFCLILIYPAWLFFLLIAWPVLAVFKILEGILWVLFWPVRAIHKKNNPEEYAAFQAEQKAKKEAAKAARKQG